MSWCKGDSRLSVKRGHALNTYSIHSPASSMALKLIGAQPSRDGIVVVHLSFIAGPITDLILPYAFFVLGFPGTAKRLM